MNRLTESLAHVCKEHLLREKWLIAPSLRVGNQWVLALTRSGQPAVNLHVQALKGLAHTLAGAALAGDGRRELTPLAGTLVADCILKRLLDRGELPYFASVEPSVGFAQAVYRSCNELRLVGLSSEQLNAKHFEDTAKGRSIVLLLREYEAALANEGWRDYADVLRLAHECVCRGDTTLADDALILVPDDTGCGVLEEALLEWLGPERVRRLAVDGPLAAGNGSAADAPLEDVLRAETQLPLAADGKKPLFQAVGEVNEVREVLRRCRANGIRLDDVEILHTDRAAYVPLIYETMAALADGHAGDEGAVPATFVEGIPCRFSRPGRALLRWLEWMRNDYPQEVFVKMVREGLLNIPLNELSLNHGQLAAACRGLRIGFGRDRYLPALDARIQQLQRQLAAPPAADGDITSQRDAWERRLRDLGALKTMTTELLAISPAADAAPADVLRGARLFLDRLARRVDEIDNYAHVRMGIDIEGLQNVWPQGEQPSAFDVRDWLSALPGEARVLGSGPRPGCLHVAPLLSGGHSGRKQTFLVGLDDGRFPGAGLPDPLLLDDERARISGALETATFKAKAEQRAFVRLLARLRGDVAFSFSCRSLSDDRELYPSPVLLALYRVMYGQPEADQSKLLQKLTPPPSFAPLDADACLDENDWWLWRLCTSGVVPDRDKVLAARFPHLGRGREACTQRASEAFTIYDGRVEQAGRDLDPTQPGAPLLSSLKLERLGRCPLSFFFQYGLEIKPPDDIAVDRGVWLDPRARGGLTHTVFERFLRELVVEERAPVYERDAPRLTALLEEHVAVYRREIPPPSDGVYHAQLRLLRQACHIFLKEEEEYCRTRGCRPIHVEEPFGMPRRGDEAPHRWPDPVAIALPTGDKIQLCGRIDRIDLIGGGAARTFAVWDYKASSFSYKQDNPFRDGRVLQPYLYLTVVGHLLGGEVICSGFFFPGTRDRGKRMAWGSKEFGEGGDLLDRLCALLRGGVFPATDNADDCRFCDYQPICGDVATVAAGSRRKLGNAANTLLQPFRELRPSAADATPE